MYHLNSTVNATGGANPVGIDTQGPSPHNPDVELTTVEKLLIIRRRRNLTVAQASRRWKLNRNTLNKWEQGTRVPRADTDKRLRKIVHDEETKGF